jgi:hypothetical protein
VIDLEVDPARALPGGAVHTGIYVRARLHDRWDSFDIAMLTRESLLTWLRTTATRAEEVVLLLLDHTTEM